MCLILVAWQSHPDYALVVAGNRDEFYARPAAAAHWWQDAHEVLGGRDLAEVIGDAGTWMGVANAESPEWPDDSRARFAALTNYRAPSEKRTDARSRGELVSHFLRGNQTADEYLHDLARAPGAYNGFNLLASDLHDLWWYSNRSKSRQPQKLKPGLYGLSNALLDTPWPKVRSRVGAMCEVLAADRGQSGSDPEPYLQLLADEKQAPDWELPSTGVAPEWEKLLSSAFIRSPSYGTRASTVLRVRHDGRFDFVERSFDADGKTGEVSYQGRLKVARDTGTVPAPR
ncbi:NRDE family protein [Cupriavidus sp. CER94]|uniref:NRDE family protein n=1 Tax=Cupriavidus sp. CER94 TaxID=3377036 RepID=UPI00380E7CBF